MITSEHSWTVRGVVLVLAFTAISIVANAESLKGRVLDPQGNAVAGAELSLFNRNTGEVRTTTTVKSGDYEFGSLPSGQYLLEGKASTSLLSRSISMSLAGDQTLDLQLTVSPASATVLVTASAVPLSLQESAKAIDVVSAEDLNLRSEFSVTEAVRNLPGMQVQTQEGPGSFTRFKTRGLRPQDTALLIDGMRFHDAGSPQNDATAFLEDMFVTDTDRIEFLRGSGSSLYGSNALGGVVNITSNAGGNPAHRNLTVEGGGIGLWRGVAGASGALLGEKLTYSGAATHLYVTKGVRDGLHYRNNGGQGTLKYSFSPGISLTGRAWYSNGYLHSTESPSLDAGVLANSVDGKDVRAVPLALDQLERLERGETYSVGNATFIPSILDPDGRRQGSYLSGMAIFQHDLPSGSTSYRVAYQAVDTRRALLDGPKGAGPFEAFATARTNFDGFVDTLQFRLDQRAGRYQSLTFGFEHERERYLSFDGNHSGSLSANRVDLKQRSNAFYLQDQIRLLDGQLQFTLAGRVQSFDLDNPEFQGFTNPYSGSISTIEVPTAYTGDGAVAYFVRSTNTKLRSHIGNSFRAPSGYERFGGGSGFYFGDPRLAPERAISVDAGVDQWFLDSKVQISGTWFYTNLQQTVRFENSFAPGTDPFNRPFGGYANGVGGIARGVELSGSLSPATGTRLQATYTYVNSDSKTPTITGSGYYRTLGLSPHVLSLTATQWFGTHTQVTLDLAAYSDYALSIFGGGTRRFIFDGMVKPDIAASHRFPLHNDHWIEIFGRLENMLGQRHYQDGFVGPKAWVTTGLRFDY